MALDLSSIGHGHVVKRPDGALARCGGQAICTHCKLEAEVQRLQGIEKALEEVDHIVQKHMRIGPSATFHRIHELALPWLTR